MSTQRTLLIKTDAQRETAGEKVVHLGPWCRGAHDASGFSRLIPQYLDNIDNVERLHELSNGLFDVYLKQLAVMLNCMHGVSWSDRSWQVLIGPWLTVFLDVVIDRFEALNQSRSQPLNLYTVLAEYPYAAWVVNDTGEFAHVANESDEFNEYLFSKILMLMPDTGIEIVDTAEAVRIPLVRPKPKFGIKHAILDILESLGNIVAKIPRRITFVDAYFHPLDQIVLELKLGQIPLFLTQDSRVESRPIDAAMRQSIEVQPYQADALHVIIAKLLPELLPKTFLEEFKCNLDGAIAKYPRKTKIIATLGAYIYREGFRFWIASQINSGTKLMGIQHGGGYGTGRRYSALDFEFSVVDYYCTAGWTERQASFATLIPMPIPKLATSKKLYAAAVNNEGSGLWVWRATRKYAFRISEGSISKDTEEYIEAQWIFGRELRDSIRKQFVVRLYGSASFGGEEDLVRREFSEMQLDQGNIPFKQLALGSRLWIITNNGTLLLEALVANVPFVAFWNPEHCINRLSEEAVPFFEQLKRCGVFHDSPESAARVVNEHFDNPANWWNGEDIQRARSEFCERFALTREDWLDIWSDKLKQLTS